eukprot:COSAG04_NODE_19983_length_403_cov_1.039474_1_plen_50_part_10
MRGAPLLAALLLAAARPATAASKLSDYVIALAPDAPPPRAAGRRGTPQPK